MEGELAFHTPPRPPRVSFEGRDGCGFASPTSTWASQLGTLRDSPSSCVSDGRGGGNGGSGFSSPTWGSPLETLFHSPSSRVSDRHIGGNGSGFSSPTWGSTLETLFNLHSSPVSDIPGAGNGSMLNTPKQASPLETLLNSPSSCVSDSRGSGNGSGFSTTKKVSPLEPLLNSPSSSISDNRGGGNGSGFSTTKKASPLLNSPSSFASESRGCGNSSSSRISKERDSEHEQLKKAESLLRAITERYNHCFLCLRDATAELADLRRERVRLGAENLRLSLLLEELDTAEQSKQASAVALTPPPKPAQDEAASTLKSISIRSNGFLSKKQPQGVGAPQRLRVRASQAMEDAGEKEKKDDGEVEVEAFRQGAVKTELCNKWGRGACPYDGRCRFAHGMEELRPVIRHPRYKTLPCQLFAAGSGCPYGHRCHFRHSMVPTAESC